MMCSSLTQHQPQHRLAILGAFLGHILSRCYSQYFLPFSSSPNTPGAVRTTCVTSLPLPFLYWTGPGFISFLFSLKSTQGRSQRHHLIEPQQHLRVPLTSGLPTAGPIHL